jgi:hypothetical protein
VESYIIGLGSVAAILLLSAAWHWHFGGARLFRGIRRRIKSN